MFACSFRSLAAAALVSAAGMAVAAPATPVQPGVAAAPARTRAESPDSWRESGQRTLAELQRAALAPTGARNVILFVGDGMGVATVTAARILDGQQRGASGEENVLAFERFPATALSKTYTVDMQTSESAGTMTALMTGVKTRGGAIAVDQVPARGTCREAAGHELPTLLERAERAGMATGVVSTARITHATPAACYAHVPERDWESDADLPGDVRAGGFPDIARQLVELPGDGPEVLLGGGRQALLPREARDPEYPDVRGSRLDRRDLIAEWRQRHPDGAWVWNASQLAALDIGATPRLLGLFEPSHLRFEADRAADPGGEPSLAEMVDVALGVLSRDPDGFFLMVEAGRIDHAHHASNARRALLDTIALSDAVERALERTRGQRTLIAVTADHSHVLTLSGYPARGNPILGLVRTRDGELARDALGLPYTTLSYANGPGYPGKSDPQPAGPKRFPHQPTRAEPAHGRPDLSRVDTAAPDYLQESAVPLPAETHGGEDVPVYAGGPGAPLLHGVQEQSYVYHAIVRALGWLD
jgi:alkaline phosphatase